MPIFFQYVVLYIYKFYINYLSNFFSYWESCDGRRLCSKIIETGSNLGSPSCISPVTLGKLLKFSELPIITGKSEITEETILKGTREMLNKCDPFLFKFIDHNLENTEKSRSKTPTALPHKRNRSGLLKLSFQFPAKAWFASLFLYCLAF